MEAPFIPPRSSSIRQPVDQYKHTQQVDRHSVTSSSPPLPQANNCQQPPSDISTRRADARRSTRDPQHQRDFLVYIQREIGAGNLPRNLHQYSPGARGHLLKEAYRVYLTRQSNATPTTPGSPVHTLKRKASDTELEGSARGPPPRYTPGASAAEAIDLTSPPRYSSMSTTQQRQSHRHSSPTQCRPSATSSPVVLPPWQPDADALQCPCCFTEFGWVTRKHHCRKCGRVVCSSCSTHRIAIPSKYQVHPPETNTTAAFPSFFNVSPEQSRHPGRQDHLSDVTEKTRVCDPCVPDPNPYPHVQAPPSSSGTATQHAQSSNLPRWLQDPSTGYPQTALGPPPIPDRRGSGYGPTHAGPYAGPATSQPSADPHATSSSYMASLRRSTMHSQRPSATAAHPQGSDCAHHPPPNIFPGHRHASSLSSFRNRPRGYGHDYAIGQSPSHPVPSPTPPQPPRREIAEDDECPICQRELPPKGPNGETTEREQHVEDCIKQYSTSASSSTAMLPPPTSGSAAGQHRGSSNPPPIVTAAGIMSASAPSRSSHFPGRSSSMSQPPQPAGTSAAPYRPNRLLPYIATEKDCTTASGEPVECVICFEEFEPGDKMARLDCFCKFHHQCIISWFNTKETKASCPTHQISEL